MVADGSPVALVHPWVSHSWSGWTSDLMKLAAATLFVAGPTSDVLVSNGACHNNAHRGVVWAVFRFEGFGAAFCH